MWLQPLAILSPSLHLLLYCVPLYLFKKKVLLVYSYHSLYLCLLALCVCIDFVAVHALCFSPLFDRGSEMESQAAKWNQSLFFSLFSPATLQQTQTPLALNLCLWNELFVLWLSPRLSLLSYAPQVQLSNINLHVCQKVCNIAKAVYSTRTVHFLHGGSYFTLRYPLKLSLAGTMWSIHI